MEIETNALYETVTARLQKQIDTESSEFKLKKLSFDVIDSACNFIDEMRLPVKNALPMLSGMSEYKFNKILKNLVYLLYKTHPVSRGIRGDGNCFYRSLGFALIEMGLTTDAGEQLVGEIIDQIINFEEGNFFDLCKNLPRNIMKCKANIQSNFFHNLWLLYSFRGKLENEKGKPSEIINKLEKLMNTDELFDTAVVLLVRRLSEISARMSKDNLAEIFPQEIADIKQYGTEAEQIIINCLAKHLNIRIAVNYLEKRQANENDLKIIFDIHEGHSPKLDLDLYFRPGHYDVCYSKKYSTIYYLSTLKENYSILQEYQKEMTEEQQIRDLEAFDIDTNKDSILCRYCLKSETLYLGNCNHEICRFCIEKSNRNFGEEILCFVCMAQINLSSIFDKKQIIIDSEDLAFSEDQKMGFQQSKMLVQEEELQNKKNNMLTEVMEEEKKEDCPDKPAVELNPSIICEDNYITIVENKCPIGQKDTIKTDENRDGHKTHTLYNKETAINNTEEGEKPVTTKNKDDDSQNEGLITESFNNKKQGAGFAKEGINNKGEAYVDEKENNFDYYYKKILMVHKFKCGNCKKQIAKQDFSYYDDDCRTYFCQECCIKISDFPEVEYEKHKAIYQKIDLPENLKKYLLLKRNDSNNKLEFFVQDTSLETIMSQIESIKRLYDKIQCAVFDHNSELLKDLKYNVYFCPSHIISQTYCIKCKNRIFVSSTKGGCNCNRCPSCKISLTKQSCAICSI